MTVSSIVSPTNNIPVPSLAASSSNLHTALPHLDLLDQVVRGIEQTGSLCKDDDLLLSDVPSLYRHLSRARYSSEAAVELVLATLDWRKCQEPLGSYSLSDLSLLRHRAFQHHGLDQQGRPGIWVDLAKLLQVKTISQESPIKRYLVLQLEALRRWTQAHFDQTGRLVPAVLVIDLKDVPFTALDLDLAPFLVEILRTHFPRSIAAVHVLHYGWTYAGLWALLRRLVSERACSRITFIQENRELQDHFDAHCIPQRYGGSLVEEADEDVWSPESCPFLQTSNHKKDTPWAPRGSGEEETISSEEADEDNEEDEDEDEGHSSTAHRLSGEKGIRRVDSQFWGVGTVHDIFYDAEGTADTTDPPPSLSHERAMLALGEAEGRIAHLEMQLRQTQDLAATLQARRSRPAKTVTFSPASLHHWRERLGRWWVRVILSTRTGKWRESGWWKKSLRDGRWVWWVAMALMWREGMSVLLERFLINRMVGAAVRV